MCWWRNYVTVDRLSRIFTHVDHRLDAIERLIMATAAENQATLNELAAQADKAKGEIVAQVAALEAAAVAGQELDFTALKAAVGGLDDLNADAVVPVEEAPVEEAPVDPEVPVDPETDPAA